MINFYSSEKSNINFIYFYIIIMSSYYNNKIHTDPEFYDKEKKELQRTLRIDTIPMKNIEKKERNIVV